MLQIALFTLQVVGALILGFVAPGYCLARCLRARDRLLWSFPLSLVLLFAAIFAVGCLREPLAATMVAAVLLAITLILAAIGSLKKNPPLPIADSLVGEARAPVAGWISACIIGSLGVLLAVVIWRTTLWPLSGFDNSFRWDFLARRMLQQHGFGFYPPLNAADYRLYFYSDGIPPLASFTYWWLYAATGGYHPALTSILIAAQLAFTLGFTWRIGRMLASPLAGFFSAAILGGSSLFVHAVAIGQETGLTALAITAMICAVVEGTRNAGMGVGADARPTTIPTWQPMVLAGLAAALGALAREYGCAFPVLGAVAVLWIGGRAKNAAILCATAALVAGPWYLRNFLRAGNPFFSDRFGSFYVNPIHAAMLDFYRTQFGLTTWDASRWADVLWQLLLQAPLQITLGIAGTVMLFRKFGFFAVIAGAIGLLWLYSIGVTAGDWQYSLRVLSPLLVALSIPAGILLARWSVRPARRAVLMTLLAATLLWTIATATIHPLDPTLERFERWTDQIILRPPARHFWWDDLPGKLPPGSRILCSDAYMYSDLQLRGLAQPGLPESGPASKVDLVPVWSPEVAFIADDTLTPAAVRQRLLDRGIRYVVVQHGVDGEFLTNHYSFYREALSALHPLYGKVGVFYVFDLGNDADKPAGGADGG